MPRFMEGAGTWDGETCERVWSELALLSSSLKHMGYRAFVDLLSFFMDFWNFFIVFKSLPGNLDRRHWQLGALIEQCRKELRDLKMKYPGYLFKEFDKSLLTEDCPGIVSILLCFDYWLMHRPEVLNQVEKLACQIAVLNVELYRRSRCSFFLNDVD